MDELRGNGFLLRPFREGDATSLKRHINNRKIVRYTLRIPYPYTRQDADAWIAACAKERKAIRFAIDIDGEAVGGISVEHVEDHKGEIGYWLSEAYWGRGIMTEAVRLVAHHAMRKRGLRRVYACVFPSNAPSARVLEKAGFRREGLLRKNVMKDGKLHDEIVFAKVR